MIGPDSSLHQMLTDPDEGPFLWELIGPTSRAPTRRAAVLLDYARHLEGRQDRRGEFLRLEHLLSGPGGELTPARQARHRELRLALAPFAAWLEVVRQTDHVLNCGLATDEPRRSASGCGAPAPGRDCPRPPSRGCASATPASGRSTTATVSGRPSSTPSRAIASRCPGMSRRTPGRYSSGATWACRTPATYGPGGCSPTGPAEIPLPDPARHERRIV